jgi:hypothetical protein
MYYYARVKKCLSKGSEVYMPSLVATTLQYSDRDLRCTMYKRVRLLVVSGGSVVYEAASTRYHFFTSVCAERSADIQASVDKEAYFDLPARRGKVTLPNGARLRLKWFCTLTAPKSEYLENPGEEYLFPQSLPPTSTGRGRCTIISCSFIC